MSLMTSTSVESMHQTKTIYCGGGGGRMFYTCTLLQASIYIQLCLRSHWKLKTFNTGQPKKLIQPEHDIPCKSSKLNSAI